MFIFRITVKFKISIMTLSDMNKLKLVEIKLLQYIYESEEIVKGIVDDTDGLTYITRFEKDVRMQCYMTKSQILSGLKGLESKGYIRVGHFLDKKEVLIVL